MSLSAEQRSELVERAQDTDGALAGWRAERAVKALAKHLRQHPDEALAGDLLALADGEHAVALTARKALVAGAGTDDGVAALAACWAARRDPLIVDVLAEAAADVGHAPTRLPLSLALGQQPETLAGFDEDQLGAAIACVGDADAQIAQAVRELLLTAADGFSGIPDACSRRALAAVAQTPSGVQRIVDAWLSHRNPVALEALREVGAKIDATRPDNVPALVAIGQLPQGLSGFGEQHAQALLACLEDRDQTIAKRVAQTLATTKRQQVVDALARLWQRSRSAQLYELIKANRTLPSHDDLALYASVARRSSEVVDCQGVPAVRQVLGILDDPDPALVQDAAHVLSVLRSEACQHYLCDEALRGDERARQATIAGRYLPRGDAERAAFLLLTDQWERYRDFDLDGRLAATYYSTAGSEMRARLRDIVRRSGQTHLLQMLLGGDRRNRVRHISRREADYLADHLIAEGHYEQAWRLVVELPFEWALQLAAKLRDARWKPDRPDERRLHEEAVEAHDRGDAAQVAALPKSLPLAIHRADAHIRGGVNSVSFAPDALQLAIGTSARQVGVFDLRAGELAWRQAGFSRSIAHVLHGGGQTLYAAECTSTPENQCGLYRVSPEGIGSAIGAHRGSITGLAKLPDETLVTVGQDSRILLHRADARQRFTLDYARRDDWPRAIATSHDGEQAVCVHRGVSLVSLASGRVLGMTDFVSPASSVTFAPQDKNFVVGMRNGWVGVCHLHEQELQMNSQLQSHATRVVGVGSVASRGTVVTAAEDGLVRIHEWSSRAVIGEIPAGSGIESLTISPDGAWIAMGHADYMSLWDFRVADIAAVFSRPLVDATPAHLGLAETVAENTHEPARRRCVQTLAAMLRFRFRHDIEIAEAPVAIRAGEFDIELG